MVTFVLGNKCETGNKEIRKEGRKRGKKEERKKEKRAADILFLGINIARTYS